MTDGRVPRVAALVREAVAVLAAILIAFALDAWWDERKERSDMLEALSSVAVEVERNIVLVNEAIEYNEGQVALAEEALSLGADEIRRLGDDEVMRFANLPNYWLVALEFGAVEAFIQGGYLPALDDVSRNEVALRAVIAGMPRLQRELDEEADVMKDSMSRLTPRIMDRMPSGSMGAVEAVVGPVGTRALLENLVEGSDVRPMFFERTFVLGFLYGGELERTLEALQEAGAAIDARLGRSASPD